MIPVCLKITNFLSHSNSEIDFTKLDAVTLIVGVNEDDPSKSNGSGKSSIIDAITYALFDKCRVNGSSSSTIDDVIRNGHNKAEVEFQFEINGVLHRIVRSRTKRKNSGKSNVTFHVRNSKKWSSVAEDTLKLTNQKIVKTIGIDYDVFINSVLLAQHDAATFAYKTSNERKEIVSNILQLNHYDDYYKKAKEQYDTVKRQLERVREYLEEHSTALVDKKQLELDLNSLQQQIEIQEAQINSLHKTIEKLRDKQQIEQKKVLNKRNLIEKRDGIKERLALASRGLKNVIHEHKQNEKIVEKTRQSIKDKRARVLEIRETRPEKNGLQRALKKWREKAKECCEAYDSCRVEARTIKGQIEALKEEKERVVELGEGACPVCYQSVTDESKEEVVEEINNKLRVLVKQFRDKKSLLENIIERKEKAEEELGKAEEVESLFDKLTKEGRELIGDIKEEEESLKERERSLENTQAYKKNSSDELTKAQQLLCDCEEDLEKAEDSKKFEQLAEKICEKNINVEVAESRINNLKIKLGTLQEQIRVSGEEEEKIRDHKGRRLELEKQCKIQKTLVQAFGKTGIQALILDNTAVEIESIVNDLLYKITDGKISIKIITQKENKDGTMKEVFDVIITDEFHSSPFNLYSGGEKFRIAFAIRIALSMLLARRSGTKVSAIFYDEAFNDLDKSGIDKLMEVFQVLSQEFRYQLIITHQTELKNRFTDILEVHKTAKGSKIVQQ